MDKHAVTDYATDFVNRSTYNPPPMDAVPWLGLAILGLLFASALLAIYWQGIRDWIDRIRYRNNTIKSFVICQKDPAIDLKKIYRVVDDTNNFLRGRDMRGIKVDRKKIKTKNLISITSLPGNGCYYFVIWYKG